MSVKSMMHCSHLFRYSQHRDILPQGKEIVKLNCICHCERS